MVKRPATHCSCYEVEISREKFFAAMLRPVKSAKIFKILGYTVHPALRWERSGLRALKRSGSLGTRLVCMYGTRPEERR